MMLGELIDLISGIAMGEQGDQSGHLAEFCRKCSLCFRSTAVS
jgi:hypothetical protein